MNQADVSRQTALPILVEGMYNWIACLPSRRSPKAPVPNRFFGRFLNGAMKVRGLEVRRSDTPRLPRSRWSLAMTVRKYPKNPVKGDMMMFRYRAVAWIILAGIVVWSGQASAGWVIDQVMKGGGEGARQQVLLQANRMKTLMLGEDGAPFTAFILDLNAETITQVDYKRKHYITTTVQEFGQMMQGVQQAMSGRMAEAMKQMQEQMKDMPPEQRKMMEEMMGSGMPKTGPAPQDCVEPKIELKKTGQQATIAGYPAVRYDVLADGKLESELWLANGITAWREMDPQKLERFAAEMAKLAPRCNPAARRLGFRGDDPTWKLANEGYPVRAVHRGSGGAVEVVKAESWSVPTTEFQPPAGFARKTFQEMMRQ